MQVKAIESTIKHEQFFDTNDRIDSYVVTRVSYSVITHRILILSILVFDIS